jgi:hypothetical protein
MLPKTVLRAASASVLAALLCGCLGVGPTSIKANRVGYNLAINQTNDQELLLNIVRMHYRDTLYFTSVQSILASASVAGSLAANFNAGFTGSVLTSQSVGVGPAAISVTENPTIVYAPIEGEKFVRQMMTPMNPDTLMLLIESGWSMDRVFSLGLSQMSGLPNAPTASGPTPSYQPVFADFKKAVLLLRVLQREHNLNIERRGDGLECVIPNPQANRESASQLRQMLHIQPDLDHFRFVVGDAPLDGHIVSIKTRSLLATLNYLSQGVEAPQGDIAAGKVRTTVKDDGKTPFDWQELLGEVIRIRSAPLRPQDASVAVYYRSRWFYIADNDLDSKSTFLLLTQLISLHSVPPTTASNISYSVGH